MSVEPTGASHDVPPADLFFSMTDAKGVITEANEVFERNARHSRAALLGAPHNLIRHPDMPGGVFALMWDMLEAGAPVCAYVRNLAGDGSAYDAFATIVAVPGGYLSVRSAPAHHDAHDLLMGLYAVARDQERAAREDGASAHDAARVGVGVLAGALADQGFGTYEDLMLDLVPHEQAARRALAPPPELHQPDEVHSRLLDHAVAVHDDLGAFSEALTASLAPLTGLARELRRLEHLCEQRDGVDEVLAAIGGARTRHTAVMGARKRLRLAAILAGLHAEAIARYVAAVNAGAEDPRVSHRAVTALTDALAAILNADDTADRAATVDLQAGIGALTAVLADHQGTPQDDQAAPLQTAASRVTTAAAAVTPGGAALDTERLRDQLAHITALAALLEESHPS